jgi:hypothetical protein
MTVKAPAGFAFAPVRQLCTVPGETTAYLRAPLTSPAMWPILIQVQHCRSKSSGSSVDRMRPTN